MTQQEVLCTLEELLEFSSSYKQRSGEHVRGWILRVWDNGRRNINLDQAEFIDVGPLSRDFRFNVTARSVKKRY